MEVEDEAEDGDRGWRIGGEDDAARNGLRINDGKVNCEHRGNILTPTWKLRCHARVEVRS